jgi:hypothetical protein
MGGQRQQGYKVNDKSKNFDLHVLCALANIRRTNPAPLYHSKVHIRVDESPLGEEEPPRCISLFGLLVRR